MLPLVFQNLLPNFLLITVIYVVVQLIQRKINVQGIALVQMMNALMKVGIISILTAWTFGFFGMGIAIAFFVVALLTSSIYSMVQTKASNSGEVNGFVVFSLFILVLMSSVTGFMSGSILKDWYVFQHECPLVQVSDLPNHESDAFVVSHALIQHQYTGHYSWVTTDAEGDSTTHHAYYAPLVDLDWTIEQPVKAWVDMDDSDVEWVGRIIRDGASENEWVAVANAKVVYGLTGIGDGEDTFRVVESDEKLIEGIKFQATFNMVVQVIIVIFTLFSLFWVRHDGARSAR